MKFNFPAVYRFISTTDSIIYVGSAKVLSKRMAAHRSNGHLPKECYENISRIEYIKCPTHGDALKLESELIDYYIPRYNKQLKRKDIDVKYNPTFEKLNWKTYKELKALDQDKINTTERQDKILIAAAYVMFVFIIARFIIK